ncbi:MAG: hypothetical protein H0V83_11400 [Rubrobacter sp.]|nr:hypothetical protein [Rubrobacter sp.]
MKLKQNTLTFGILAAAFVFSAAYQLYRATLMQVPDDAFTVGTGFAYAIFVGISALVLTDRRWAWWMISAFVLVLVAVGAFWYFPVVAVARIEAGAMGPIGWLEATVYLGLLFVAGFLYTLRLLGARLVPSKG